MPTKSVTTNAAPKRADGASRKAEAPKNRVPGLFERWMSVEKSRGRTTGEILAELNQEAGTIYKHNWPSVVAGRNYEMERCPVAVRRHMMRVVLQDELKNLGFDVTPEQLEHLTVALT